jgi:hypothetical protein
MSENTQTPPKQYASFDEFWPDYVRAHTNRTCRQLHFVGLTLAAASIGGALLFRKRSLLLAAPVFGYGFAWFGHFVFEKNVPLTFTHPVFSLRADWLMWAKMATGKMDAEVERYVAEKAAEVAPVEAESANGAAVDVTAN